MLCENCRQQLLPYLYDLLDPPDRAALAAHLETCAECQAALALAREQQGMLAEAVRESHAGIVFKAPVQAAVPSSSAPTVLMPRPRRRSILFNRWAAAAALFLVFVGAGSLLGWSIWRDQDAAYAEARQKLARAKDDLSKSQDDLDRQKGKAQQNIRAIQEQIDTLFTDWKKEESKNRKVLEDKGAQLIIKGPLMPQPGARNDYEVELRQDGPLPRMQQQDFNKNSTNKEAQDNKTDTFNKAQNELSQMSPLNVRVFNQRNNETLLKQKVQVQGPNNSANFSLPSNLPIKPGDPIAMEFQIEDAAGKLLTWSDNLRLVFPEYVTHLATDRPLYRPGDTVRFRSLTLERFSLQPAQQKFHLRYRIAGPGNVELYNQDFASIVAGANKEPIKGPDGVELHCLGVGDFTLPADAPDGPYTLTVSEDNERFNEEKRSFQVRRLAQPRFVKDLQFHRSIYGAGDQLKMKWHFAPGPVADKDKFASASVRVVVDGAEVKREDFGVFGPGERELALECNLPAQLDKGVGKVIFEFGVGDNRQTMVREIPLVVRDLQVEFYPEGGDLIADVPNRVYFAARNPANQPADLAGRIVDDKGNVAAHVQTVSDDKEPALNQGLGSFIFTPELKKNYRLVLDSPIGIPRTFGLPESKEHGVVMTIPEGVVENNIEVELMSVERRRVLLVGAYCRGRVLDHKVVRAGGNQPVSVTLRPDRAVGGVYRITVFEAIRTGDDVEFRPLAERLIYRKNTAQLDITCVPERGAYQPGELVRLMLKARNERMALTPTLAMVAVVDERVLKPDLKTSRGLPAHFFLATEVRNPEDLENADFLLSDHPRAAQALDLLLGTQGWRRFAEQDPQKFQERLHQARPPAFLSNTIHVTQFLENEQQQIAKLDQAYVEKALAMQRELTEVEKHDAGPADLQKQIERQQTQVDLLDQNAANAEQRLGDIRAVFVQFVLGAVVLALVFVGFLFVSVGIRRLSTGAGSARPWLLSGGVLLGLLLIVSLVGTFALRGDKGLDNMWERDRAKFRLGVNRGPGPDLRVPGPAVVTPVPVDVAAEEDRPIDDALKGSTRTEELKKKADGPAPTGAKDTDKGDKQSDDKAKEKIENAVVGPPGILLNEKGNERRGQVVFAGNDAQDERLLRQSGNYQAILRQQLGRRVELPAADHPCIVREYAHQRQPSPDGIRRDHTATICWQPVLVMPEGSAEVAFDLPESVTSFQVLVHANTFDGRIGSKRVDINAQPPLTVKLAAPAEVSDQDQVAVTAEVRNSLSQATTGIVSARSKGLHATASTERRLTLAPGQSKREGFKFKPAAGDGIAAVRVVGKSDGFADASESRVQVVGDGFPVTRSVGGVIDNGSAEFEIDLPDTMIPGSLAVRASIYPSPLADLQSARDALAIMPAGSLEQKISRVYPNVLILQYLKQPGSPFRPQLEKRARLELQAAFPTLTAFESADGGYAKFPAANPIRDESATAFGLLHLREVARVQALEAEQLNELAKTFRNPDAYTAWAVTEGGSADELSHKLKLLDKEAKSADALALMAMSYQNNKDITRTEDYLQRLRDYQKPAGVVGGPAGRASDVETTALAVLAWVRGNKTGAFEPNLHTAVKWLHQQRRGSGDWGSSQATVLALKALAAYDQKTPRTIPTTDAHLTVRGPADKAAVGARASLTSRSQDAITLELGNADKLRPGKHIVQLNLAGSLPYTITWSYRTRQAVNDPQTPVKLAARLSKQEAKEGETVKLSASLENVAGKRQGVTVAVMGLPGGVSADEAQLKALQAAGTISAWELRGRELALFWRELAPAARLEVSVNLRCVVPGVYRGPASRAYVDGDGERVFWAAPVAISIAESE
jgi:hypothetical protein